MVAFMSEDTVLKLGAVFSALAFIVPMARLMWTIWATARPRTLIFMDHEGHVVKEISADSVPEIDNRELVDLHNRIRQKNDITVRAA
jgi:hypothetical protein